MMSEKCSDGYNYLLKGVDDFLVINNNELNEVIKKIPLSYHRDIKRSVEPNRCIDALMEVRGG